MARLPRYVIPGQPQHIIQRGNNRQVIFRSEGDDQFFRDCLVEAAGRFGLAIHAYVWMTNHIHLLATPTYEDSISKTFQSAGRKYVQYFNFTYKRSGPLWEGRYRATVVDTENYLLKLMRYIEVLEQCLGRKAKLDLLPLQAGDVPETIADVSRLQAAIAFKPSTPIEAGIARFVEWYRSYYKV